MTIRQIVSDIRSVNKLISEDSLITDRTLASEIKTTAAILIRRELLLRRLWNTPTIFTTVKCIKMCEAPLAECCNYTSPCTIRKSACKIKGIADLGTFGLAIQGVFNIDGSKRFKETNPIRFENLMKMPKLRGKGDYFWFQDNYLYISDSDVEAVTLIAYFDNDLIIEGDNCQCDTNDDTLCENPLDRSLKCPDHLIKNIKDMVNERIGTSFRTAVPDFTSDDKEDSR